MTTNAHDVEHRPTPPPPPPLAPLQLLKDKPYEESIPAAFGLFHIDLCPFVKAK